MIIQSIKVYNFTIFFGSSLIFSCPFSDPKIQKKKKGKKKDQTNHQKNVSKQHMGIGIELLDKPYN